VTARHRPTLHACDPQPTCCVDADRAARNLSMPLRVSFILLRCGVSIWLGGSRSNGWTKIGREQVVDHRLQRIVQSTGRADAGCTSIGIDCTCTDRKCGEEIAAR
jgi:hypothetical protein